MAKHDGKHDGKHDWLIPGKKVDLRKIDPASVKHLPGGGDREKVEAITAKDVARIGEFQDLLYAEGRHSMLVILQGMDASGKDGAVRRVFDAVNPTGISVVSFKAPTPLERRHDFLWRCHQAAPPRGIIGVFNRSYYEEVLIVRVHPERFLPEDLRHDKHLWEERYELINDFERVLEMNDTRILKFFLHISKDKQRERFEERQKDPTKHWKLAAGDFEERAYWDDYQAAYEQMLAHTSTARNPWHIIPADRKWVRNHWMAQVICAAMDEMDLKFPPAEDPELIQRKFK